MIRPTLGRATPISRLSTIWWMQFAVIGLLWLFVEISPIPKGDPRWYAMLATSMIVSLFQLAAHGFMEIDVRFWERSRANYEESKEASEKLSAEVQENLRSVRREIADMDHRHLEWKREVNRYARSNGMALPYPSVETEEKPVTKN